MARSERPSFTGEGSAEELLEACELGSNISFEKDVTKPELELGLSFPSS